MEKPAITNYPIHELISRRWSPRAFADQPVSDEQVRILLEAARWAPSCFNEQPWRYLVASRARPDHFQAMLDCLVESNQRWASSAGVLMITVAATNFARGGKPNRHAWHDVGLASATMTVQAMAMGLMVHQMAGFDAGKARERYRIPEGHEPATAIAIGYPGDPEQLPEDLRQRELAPRTRKPLAEIAFQESWGVSLTDLDT